MEQLETELKELILESLNLEDMTVEEVETEAPLFGEGLGLDSIDALELGIAIKKKYNLTLDGDSADNKAHFYSVSSLAKFIDSQKTMES